MIKIQRRLMDEKDKARPVVVTGPGKTEQSHKKQCDMNFILREYQRTGLIRHAAKHAGQYDDVTSVEFDKAMYLVKNAQNMFEALPGNIRKRFQNSPSAFLEFVQDPANKQEMARLGILKGNDGINIEGAQVNSPVEEPVEKVVDPSSVG